VQTRSLAIAYCREVFPAQQGLCAYHVRAAIQQVLQQKLRGSKEERASAYESFEKVVEAIMYLRPCDTEDATRAEANKNLLELKTE
jgi:hypothetical protein